MAGGPGVDFAQGPDRDFSVNLRGVQSGVSEQLLGQADIRRILQLRGGVAVNITSVERGARQRR